MFTVSKVLGRIHGDHHPARGAASVAVGFNVISCYLWRLLCAMCLALPLAACKPTTAVTYSPPIIPITFSIDNSWQISVTLGARITSFLGTFSIGSGITTGPDSNSTRLSIISAINRTVRNVYDIHERGTMTLCINGLVEEQISARSIVVTVLSAPSVVKLLPANARSCAFHSQSSGPASSPRSKRTRSRQRVKVRVPAGAEGGVPTGVEIKVGDRYSVSATGSAQYGYDPGDSCPGGYPTTYPDGSRYLGGQDCGPKNDPSAVQPTAPIGLLIWRIGDGPWQSAPASFTATTAGSLFLGYNDDPGYYGDNSGSYRATVTCSSGC